DDGRGPLENGGQYHEPAARRPFAQDVGVADAEIRFTPGDRLRDVDPGTAFADADVETGGAVEALFKGLVVAGELKLMLPFELHRYGIECSGRMRGCQHQASAYD